MKKALIVLVVVAAILTALFFAFKTKEGPIQLVYKFKPGQVDNYRTNTTMKMDSPGFFGGSGSSTTMKTVMTMTQKVVKVNRDGSARIEYRINVRSGGGGPFGMPPLLGEPYQMTVNKYGKVTDSKDIKRIMSRMGGALPGMDFSPSSQMNMGSMLPSRGVAVGQTWTEPVPFPMGGGQITDTATLVADDYKLGTRKVCKIDHKYDGKIDLAEMMKSMPKSVMPMQISGEMILTGSGTIYFSRSEGKIIKSVDIGKMNTKMVFGKAPGAGGSSTGAAMTMDMVAETKSTTNLVEKKGP